MDSFVERTVDLLKANAGGSWSLVYFADHGLSMEKKPGTDSGKELEHGYDHRQNYEVPFFRISSDSHGHQVNPAYRTGFRMLEGLAGWVSGSATKTSVMHLNSGAKAVTQRSVSSVTGSTTNCRKTPRSDSEASKKRAGEKRFSPALWYSDEYAGLYSGFPIPSSRFLFLSASFFWQAEQIP